MGRGHEFEICQLSVRVVIMSEPDLFQILVVASHGPYDRFVCLFVEFLFYLFIYFTNIFLFRYHGTLCEQNFKMLPLLQIAAEHFRNFS